MLFLQLDERGSIHAVQAVLNLKGRPCPRAETVQEDGGRWKQRKEKHSVSFLQVTEPVTVDYQTQSKTITGESPRSESQHSFQAYRYCLLAGFDVMGTMLASLLGFPYKDTFNADDRVTPEPRL